MKRFSTEGELRLAARTVRENDGAGSDVAPLAHNVAKRLPRCDGATPKRPLADPLNPSALVVGQTAPWPGAARGHGAKIEEPNVDTCPASHGRRGYFMGARCGGHDRT